MRAAQTNTWTGQKSYDEFNQKAVFVTTGMMAAVIGAMNCAPTYRRSAAKEKKTGTACRAPTSVRVRLRELGAEEDGFALEGFDGDEDGSGGVDAGGGEDDGDGSPVVGAGDNFFTDEAGVENGD